MKTNYKVAIALVAGVAIGGAAIQGLHAQAKPPVFYVAEINVTNIDAYTKEYATKAVALAKASGAKFLAAGQNAVAFDGEAPSRVVVQQWESMDKVKAWRNSPEYLENRKIGEKYAKFRAFAIEGVQ
ncbi:MAG: DUF1330 domain-containing protein [Pseudolabrys sp.]|jgi:uncharacterized protein (DUF1330 family)